MSPPLPPMPQIPSGLMGRVFGHLAPYMKNLRNAKTSSAAFVHFTKRSWYENAVSETITVRMVSKEMILTKNKEHIKDVLVTKADKFTNLDTFRLVFGKMFPKSMIVIEGDDWKRVRKVSQRAFNKMDLNPVVFNSSEITLNGLENSKSFWLSEDQIDTLEFLKRATFDIFHKTIYDWDSKTLLGQNMEALDACVLVTRATSERNLTAGTPWVWDLPLPRNKQILDAINTITKSAHELLKKRIKYLENQSEKVDKTRSLIDAMVLANMKKETVDDFMADDEMTDQIATFFFGSFETTSNTLLLLLNQLANDTRVQNKLRAILKEKYPNGILSTTTEEELHSIPYLEHVMMESMRLSPIAPIFGRTALEDLTLGKEGFLVKKGMDVLIDGGSASKTDKYFTGNQKSLEEFYPERFESLTMDKLASMPFGFGSRICIGRKIARIESKAIVASILLNYELSPPKDPKANLELDFLLGATAIPGTGYLTMKRI